MACLCVAASQACYVRALRLALGDERSCHVRPCAGLPSLCLSLSFLSLARARVCATSLSQACFNKPAPLTRPFFLPALTIIKKKRNTYPNHRSLHLTAKREFVNGYGLKQTIIINTNCGSTITRYLKGFLKVHFLCTIVYYFT